MTKTDRLEKKLDRDNFISWNRQMRCLLYAQKIIKATSLPEGTEVVPEDDKDLELYAAIMLNVSDRLQTTVAAHTTGQAAYQALVDKFHASAGAQKYNYLRQLHSLKMKPNESMVYYLGRAKDLQKQMEMVNTTIDDDTLSYYVLSGLPEEYNIIVKLHKRVPQIDFSVLERELLEEEQDLQLDKSTEMRSYEKHHVGAYRAQRSGGSNFKCEHCGRIGHTAD
jgi:hypothetical protein